MNRACYHHYPIPPNWLFRFAFFLLLFSALPLVAQPPDTSRCTPPPAGMVAWWSLDETGIGPGSRVADLTGSPLSYSPANAASTGFVAGALSTRAGKVGGGFYFPNDRSQFIRVPDHPELDMGRGDFSIDAWVRIDRPVTNGVIVDKRTGGFDPRGYCFFIYGDRPGVQLADDINGWYNWVAYEERLEPGRWYMLSVTVDRDDPNGGRLYVDDRLVLTFDPRDRAGSLDNDGELFIGKSDIHASAPFYGDIDEVELFKRVLEPQEIERIYRAGSAGKCKSVAKGACDLLWKEGRAEECCSYTIGLDNRAGTLLEIRYNVLPAPGTTRPGGSIRRLFASPCGIVSTIPANAAGTTSGRILFDSACTRRGMQQLTIDASAAGADGQICIELVAVVRTPNGARVECPRIICFRCAPVAESRCDSLSVMPYIMEYPRRSVRLFTVSNAKAPASPICSLTVSLSPPVDRLSGGVLIVDGVARSWSGANSNTYTRIDSRHGLPAQGSVQFGLALDYFYGWTGTVSVTAYHCDGRSCTMTYQWRAMGGREMDLSYTTAPSPGESISVSHIAFSRAASSWENVRSIGVKVPGTILAISPAMLPCRDDEGDCNDLLEEVVSRGSVATISLRQSGRQSAGADPEIVVVCNLREGAPAIGEIVYFDAAGNELGHESVPLHRTPASTPGSSGDAEGMLRVWPNPAGSSFTVSFTMSARGAAWVEVYDLLGRMVLEQNAGMLENGQHEVALDAAQLPGGTYFVRVRGAAGGVRQMEVNR